MCILNFSLIKSLVNVFIWNTWWASLTCVSTPQLLVDPSKYKAIAPHSKCNSCLIVTQAKISTMDNQVQKHSSSKYSWLHCKDLSNFSTGEQPYPQAHDIAQTDLQLRFPADFWLIFNALLLSVLPPFKSFPNSEERVLVRSTSVHITSLRT